MFSIRIFLEERHKFHFSIRLFIFEDKFTVFSYLLMFSVISSTPNSEGFRSPARRRPNTKSSNRSWRDCTDWPESHSLFHIRIQEMETCCRSTTTTTSAERCKRPGRCCALSSKGKVIPFGNTLFFV